MYILMDMKPAIDRMIQDIILDSRISNDVRAEMVAYVRKAYRLGKDSGRRTAIGYGRILERKNK